MIAFASAADALEWCLMVQELLMEVGGRWRGGVDDSGRGEGGYEALKGGACDVAIRESALGVTHLLRTAGKGSGSAGVEPGQVCGHVGGCGLQQCSM